MKGEQTPLPPEPPPARLVVSDVMELRRMRSFYADATLHARLLAIVEHRLGHALLGAAEAAKIAVADAGSADGLAGRLTQPDALTALEADMAHIVAARVETARRAGVAQGLGWHARQVFG